MQANATYVAEFNVSLKTKNAIILAMTGSISFPQVMTAKFIELMQCENKKCPNKVGRATRPKTEIHETAV